MASEACNSLEPLSGEASAAAKANEAGEEGVTSAAGALEPIPGEASAAAKANSGALEPLPCEAGVTSAAGVNC